MIGQGRETQEDNNLFYTCGLIDYISRKTKNVRAVPSHWDIGKVYRRLIKMVVKDEKIDVIDALIEVYNSFISPKIDDYNSSVYYENPNYIFECYKAKKML